MRCQECGFELDERDLLPDGTYQCPECGTIQSVPVRRPSSRAAASPYRKRRSNFAPAGNAFTQRYFGLPLWSWIAIAVVVILGIVLLVHGLAGKPDVTTEMPPVQDVPLESTVAPDSSDGGDLLSGDVGPDADATPQPAVSTHNTGAAQNDFVVGFDWAMNYLGYNASLTAGTTETGPGGETIQHYTFDSWIELTMTLDPSTSVIRSISMSAQIAEGSTDTTPVEAAFVSAIYGCDYTISPVDVRAQIQKMLADNSLLYECPGFSAIVSTGAFSGYSLDITGRLG